MGIIAFDFNINRTTSFCTREAGLWQCNDLSLGMQQSKFGIEKPCFHIADIAKLDTCCFQAQPAMLGEYNTRAEGDDSCKPHSKRMS